MFNSENLLGATETTLNSILSGISDGSEVVHYKNAVLTAEFDVNTAEVLAKLRQKSREEIAQITSNNFYTLLTKG